MSDHPDSDHPDAVTHPSYIPDCYGRSNYYTILVNENGQFWSLCTHQYKPPEYREISPSFELETMSSPQITVLVKSFSHLNGNFFLASLEEIGKLWKWWTVCSTFFKVSSPRAGGSQEGHNLKCAKLLTSTVCLVGKSIYYGNLLNVLALSANNVDDELWKYLMEMYYRLNTIKSSIFHPRIKPQ